MRGNLCRETVLFDGMLELLDESRRVTCAWGIVTNKAERLAKPLIERLGLSERCACVIGGDTTGRAKTRTLRRSWLRARSSGSNRPHAATSAMIGATSKRAVPPA